MTGVVNWGYLYLGVSVCEKSEFVIFEVCG